MASDRAFDAVVVGAGIAGAAVAERLAARGLRRVAVLEKERTYCTGSSARSAGGVRQQFFEEAKIRAAMYSMAHFETFREEYGIDPVLRRNGYLVLAGDEKSAARLRESVALQNALGLDSRFLSPDTIDAVVPGLHAGGVAGAVFSPLDGYLDPHALVQGYVKAFRGRGGVLLTECAVRGFLLDGERVTGVMTAGGPVHAGAVVVAAGPFAGPLLRLAGVDLPLKPCRRQIFSTGPVDGIGADWPLVIDSDRFYFRPETGGVIMSLAEVEEWEPPANGNDVPLSRDGLPELARRATERCPVLAEARVSGGWAGLRTLTPDAMPVLGAVPSRPGLFVAAGFSGHGITLSRYAAEVVSAAVAGETAACGGAPAFAPARFL